MPIVWEATYVPLKDLKLVSVIWVCYGSVHVMSVICDVFCVRLVCGVPASIETVLWNEKRLNVNGRFSCISQIAMSEKYTEIQRRASCNMVTFGDIFRHLAPPAAHVT